MFNQMCEEVFESLDIEKEVFIKSQKKYTEDSSSKQELQKAIKTG